MRPRLNLFWTGLISLSFLLGLIFLYYTLFPGSYSPEAEQFFSIEQINNGREYGTAFRLLFIGSFFVESLFLIWLIFSKRGNLLCRRVINMSGSYYGSVLCFFIFIWFSLRLLSLPFSMYGDYFLQHQWGFSTQNLPSWWLYYLKNLLLDLVISSLSVLVVFMVIKISPKKWWLICAVLFSVWLVIQSLIWPIVISPIFNRFTPATNPNIISMVQDLSEKADIKVNEILIMDASTRTTKANAYFAGIGPSKQIVLYDTLISNYSPQQIEAVVAHEMAHWKQGHIYKGLVLGIVGILFTWRFLFTAVKKSMPYHPAQPPPQLWALFVLFFLLFSFLASPLENSISRNMEKEADRVAVALTGNHQAAVSLQVDLAAKNLSDVSPQAFIEWFSYSHPPALKRINNILDNRL